MTSAFRVQRKTSAPPVRIYNLSVDAASWRRWGPALVSYSELIRQSTPDPLGAGAIRCIGVLKVVRADEEILEARSPHYQRYTAVCGIPVSHYCIHRLGPIQRNVGDPVDDVEECRIAHK